MDFLGIGVLVIGIAFIIISIFLAKALNNLAKVLNGVNKTVDQLPGQLDQVMKQTSEVLHTSNDTLGDVNNKIQALSPLFYIIGDLGQASREVSSSLLDATKSMKKKTSDGEHVVGEKGLSGLTGAIAFTYFLSQRKKALKELLPQKAAATEPRVEK
ncbi:DUF948 domain-containing protein [Thalassobacillus hwangdonensis]|uniref:DUF948 domain-containing protein n=1 Tax=Thalassobacillus hwangdonensis TaxID=546108 RepID=A0ABW3L127_9BACI